MAILSRVFDDDLDRVFDGHLMTILAKSFWWPSYQKVFDGRRPVKQFLTTIVLRVFDDGRAKSFL